MPNDLPDPQIPDDRAMERAHEIQKLVIGLVQAVIIALITAIAVNVLGHLYKVRELESKSIEVNTARVTDLMKDAMGKDLETRTNLAAALMHVMPQEDERRLWKAYYENVLVPALDGEQALKRTVVKVSSLPTTVPTPTQAETPTPTSSPAPALTPAPAGTPTPTPTPAPTDPLGAEPAVVARLSVAEITSDIPNRNHIGGDLPRHWSISYRIVKVDGSDRTGLFWAGKETDFPRDLQIPLLRGDSSISIVASVETPRYGITFGEHTNREWTCFEHVLTGTLRTQMRRLDDETPLPGPIVSLRSEGCANAVYAGGGEGTNMLRAESTSDPVQVVR